MIFFTRLIIFNTLLFGASLNASDNFENYEIRFDISFPFASLEGTKKFEKTKSSNEYTITFDGKNSLLNASLSQTASLRVGNKKIFPQSYTQQIKAPFQREAGIQIINFDYRDLTIKSTGNVIWMVPIEDGVIPLDPLSMAMKMRSNLKKGITEFSLDILKLDDGEINSNDFKVTGEETLTIKDVNYPCYVVLRETENRTTRYYFAKNLDFILLKVDDQRPSRRTSINPVKILSFG